jgi:hypothetical protein
MGFLCALLEPLADESRNEDDLEVFVIPLLNPSNLCKVSIRETMVRNRTKALTIRP